MDKGRLEAFSDGVIAIIITIMVLELKAPHGANFESLLPLGATFLSYILSFVYIAIYWNNHHHLFKIVDKVNGPILWANMHLLFWLSITPFVTAWSGENHFESVPVSLYGVVLFMSGAAYFILVQVLINSHGQNSSLAKAFGKDVKGLVSIVLYAAGIGLAFFNSYIALALYVIVAIIWLIPDTRVEKVLSSGKRSKE